MEIEEEPDKGNDEGFYQSTIRLLNPSPPVQHIDPDEFREYFFLAYSSRFVNFIYVLLAIFGAQLLLQLFLHMDSSSFTQSLTEVLASNGYLSKQDAALSSRSLSSFSEQQLFLIQMILPLLVVVIAAMVCSSSSLFNARTHNWIVAGIGIATQLAIGVVNPQAVLVEDFHRQRVFRVRPEPALVRVMHERRAGDVFPPELIVVKMIAAQPLDKLAQRRCQRTFLARALAI